MKKSTLRRADLIFSYVLSLVSIYIIIESTVLFFNPFGMEFDRVKGDTIKQTIVKWYESPALMPFILGFVILLLSFVLRSIAVKDGAKLDFFTVNHVKYFFGLRETRVAAIIIAAFCLYVFVFIPQCRAALNFFPKFQGFPFMIATFLFLVLQMLAFNKRTVKATILSVVIAAVASGAITYGFGTLALIPLP